MIPSKEDLIYAAAMLDGEGCIMIGAHKNTRSRAIVYYELRVQVGMADKLIPLWLQSMFGGHMHSRWDNNPKHRRMWIWGISTQKARRVLELTLPYMKVKIAQAELGIRFQNMKVHKYYCPTRPKPDWLFEKEAAIKLKISNLNKGKYGGE